MEVEILQSDQRTSHVEQVRTLLRLMPCTLAVKHALAEYYRLVAIEKKTSANVLMRDTLRDELKKIVPVYNFFDISGTITQNEPVLETALGDLNVSDNPVVQSYTFDNLYAEYNGTGGEKSTVWARPLRYSLNPDGAVQPNKGGSNRHKASLEAVIYVLQKEGTINNKLLRFATSPIPKNSDYRNILGVPTVNIVTDKYPYGRLNLKMLHTIASYIPQSIFNPELLFKIYADFIKDFNGDVTYLPNTLVDIKKFIMVLRKTGITLNAWTPSHNNSSCYTSQDGLTELGNVWRFIAEATGGEWHELPKGNFAQAIAQAATNISTATLHRLIPQIKELNRLLLPKH